MPAVIRGTYQTPRAIWNESRGECRVSVTVNSCKTTDCCCHHHQPTNVAKSSQTRATFGLTKRNERNIEKFWQRTTDNDVAYHRLLPFALSPLLLLHDGFYQSRYELLPENITLIKIMFPTWLFRFRCTTNIFRCITAAAFLTYHSKKNYIFNLFFMSLCNVELNTGLPQNNHRVNYIFKKVFQI